MTDYTKTLPKHIEKYIGENDLFLEIFEGDDSNERTEKRPPILFVHGAYTGSWMWSKFIPHFVSQGWKCYGMNMRSHYKSRVMDMTEISFNDYLDDMKEVIAECGEAPIIIGFSMGGILAQKLAETVMISGLVLIDSSISAEVNELVPYNEAEENQLGIIVPAPVREESASIDESEEDRAFQKKYLSMESSKVFEECACWIRGIKGVSVDGNMVTCPCLVIKSSNNDEQERQGKLTAELLKAEYTGLCDTTHTGLLVGQKYKLVVDRIRTWLERF